MVDKATRGSADRTRLAVVGRYRGDVTNYTRAVVERLLQTLFGVVIDDRRPQRIQIECDGAIVNLALVTTNHIARAFAERRNRHAV